MWSIFVYIKKFLLVQISRRLWPTIRSFHAWTYVAKDLLQIRHIFFHTNGSFISKGSHQLRPSDKLKKKKNLRSYRYRSNHSTHKIGETSEIIVALDPLTTWSIGKYRTNYSSRNELKIQISSPPRQKDNEENEINTTSFALMVLL